jgi:hypothetical protein
MLRNCIGPPQPKFLLFQQLPRTLQPSEFVGAVSASSRAVRYLFAQENLIVFDPKLAGAAEGFLSLK